MSGGHYDYAYQHVNDVADKVEEEADAIPGWDNAEPRDPREAADRRKISAHLFKVSEAMRALEWCDSGDTCWVDARKQWVALGVLKKEG